MLSVGEIIGGAFRLVRTRIGAIAIWALLYLAMHVVVLQAMRPFMTNMMALQATQGGGAAPDPSMVLGAMGGIFGVSLLMLVGFLILYAAALRSAFRPDERAFAYLRLGMDEVRMLVVGLVLTVGFSILYFALVLVSALVGGAIGVIAHGAIVPVVILLMLAVLAVLVFFQVRFSLVFALTMLRRKIVIGESWTLTRGRFWTLFGAYFVLVLIVFAGAMVLFGISAGSYLTEIGRAAGNPAALQAAQQAQMARQFGPLTLWTLLLAIPGAIFMAVCFALGAGAASTATNGLREADFADIAAVYE